jgi:phage-related protein
MAETLPNIPIAFAPTYSEEPRVRRVRFGDGYEARILDGLHPVSMTTSIPWKNRSHDERNILVDFFRRHGGVRWFWWTPINDNIQRKFVCPKWTSTRANDSPVYRPRFDIQAEFYEVFDLV